MIASTGLVDELIGLDGLPGHLSGRCARGSRVLAEPCAGRLERLTTFCWHTKLRAVDGGRDKLSERERTFVGVDTWPIITPGWRSPTRLYLDDSPSRA
jgi:hypothetical protein